MKYTIKNWDGKDFYLWFDHLHNKFPMLKLFSKSISKQCVEHMEQTFNTNWLDHWKNNLPILEDFIHTGSYALFKDPHFIQILAGLELFDRNSLLAEYDMLSDANRKLADGIREERKVLGMNKVMIGHKEFLARLRAKE